MDKINRYLFNEADEKYKQFIASLNPTIKIERIIGVRVPFIRKMVKELSKDEQEQFLMELPHQYYEENLLHGFIIQKEKDFDKAIDKVEIFLPYVDNWAVSDTMGPIIFKKHHQELLPYINKWIKSKHTYTVRFAIDMLMNHFLDEDFDPKYLNIVASVKSDEYYINMMIAWYFATALAKQYETTIKLIESKSLSKWIQNKTIQKAIESNRISEQLKQYLKKFKI